MSLANLSSFQAPDLASLGRELKAQYRPPTSPDDTKALYTSVDLRVNLYALNTLGLHPAFVDNIKRQADSVACMITARFLDDTNDGYRLVGNVPTLNQEYENRMGNTVPFRNEPAAGFGTAFLVGKDLVLTAGHCVCGRHSDKLDSDRNRATRFVFGFAMETADRCNLVFKKSDVYQLGKVLAYQLSVVGNASTGFSKHRDWALVKLDREVTGRVPLKLDFARQLHQDAQLYMVGHPSGLPAKFTRNRLFAGNVREEYFNAHIDAFAGNSGSPVFDHRTGDVIGILCREADDYHRSNMGTWELFRADPQRHRETCQRISTIVIVEWFIQAQQGSHLAQINIGLEYCLASGLGLIGNLSEAKLWLQRAIEPENRSEPYSVFNLLPQFLRGRSSLSRRDSAKVNNLLAYISCQGDQKDVLLAVRCLEAAIAAAEDDNELKKRCLLELGRLYIAEEQGLAQDFRRADSYLREAAKLENATAACFLVHSQLMQGVAPSDEFVELLQRAANHGDAFCQMTVGLIAMAGMWPTVTADRGEQYLRQARTSNDPRIRETASQALNYPKPPPCSIV